MACRYGNTILDMDATYRTTQYGLPMFVMNVVDNHGHAQPIAMFFVQEESGASIAEVLRIFKQVNPNFAPSYFMIDKSDMEMNGIRAVYPDSRVLICDFHRYVPLCTFMLLSRVYLVRYILTTSGCSL
jgi:MULE transposase domain